MKKPTKTIAKKSVKKTVSSKKIKAAPAKAKKTIIKKIAAKKAVVKKAPVKKAATKSTAAKKTPIKKNIAKKPEIKKVPTIAKKSQPKTLTAAESSRKKAISIRLLRSDIEAIKIKAEKLGVGYQTYINILIHRDATSE